MISKKTRKLISSAFMDISRDIEANLLNKDGILDENMELLCGAAIIGESSTYQLAPTKRSVHFLPPISFENSVDETYQVSQKVFFFVDGVEGERSLAFGDKGRRWILTGKQNQNDLPPLTGFPVDYHVRVQNLVTIGGKLNEYGITGKQIELVGIMGNDLTQKLQEEIPHLTIRQIVDLSALVFDLTYLAKKTEQTEVSFESEYLKLTLRKE